VKDDEMVDVPGVGDRPARTLCRKLLAEIIEPRVEEMFDLVRREIMRTGYEGILAAGVVITGGTSMLEGILEAAERVLDLPVRRGVPNGVGGLRDIVSNPMYATGVGLILLARHHDGELELTGLRGGRRVGRALGRMRAWMLEFF
jgi:cell division protein FtsA